MESKRCIESKVLWFNLLSVVAIVITELSASPEFKELIGSYIYLVMIAGAVVNGLLRKYTTKPLGKEKPVEVLNPVDEALKKEDNEIIAFNHKSTLMGNTKNA